MKKYKRKVISLLLSFIMILSFLPVNVQAIGLPPTAPANLTASSIADTSVSLSWMASTDDVGVTEYEIYNGATQVGTTTGSAITYTVTGLTESTAYSFTVTAKDADGNVSPSSDALPVTTNAAADIQAPTAPSNLTTTSKTDKSVSLSWMVSTDNVGVTEYEIYNGATQVGTTTGSAITYTVTGLIESTAYSFTVSAKDVAGNVSDASNAVTVTTNAAADTQAPTAPSNLTTTSQTDTGVSLSWAASTDNVGVTEYEIYNGTTQVGTTTGAAITFTVTGLTEGTAYSFTVTAKDVAGNVSPASDALLVITNAAADTQAPTAPSNLTITSQTDTSVSLSWMASTDNVGVTEYEIYNGATQVGTTTGAAINYTVTGLTESTAYSFTVTAKDVAGNVSPASDAVAVITNAAADTQAPTAPSNLTITSQTDTSVSLSWIASTDNVGVTEYEIYNGTTQVGTTTGATINYTVTGLTESTAYSFTVTAKDVAGNVSPASDVVSITTNATADTQAPTAPSNLATTSQSDTSVSLSWLASTDNVGVTEYEIYNGVTQVGTTTGAAITFTVTGLTESTAYSFTVIAKDAAGNVSPACDALLVTTNAAADTQVPTAPSNLTTTSQTDTSVSLSWTESTDDVRVTEYEIYNGVTQVGTTTGAAITYTVTGLTESTAYSFTVTSKDAAGNVSTSSNAVAVTTNIAPDTQAPTAPSNLDTTSQTDTSISLSWTASTDDVGVTEYEIYNGTTQVGTTTGAAITFTVTGLTESTAYSFTVTSKDAAGNVSADSNAVVVTTNIAADLEIPTAPSNLTTTSQTDTSVRLSWTKSTDDVGVTEYEIYSGTTQVGTTTGTTTTYTVNGLTKSTSYRFTVTAKDEAGNVSVASNAIAVFTAVIFSEDTVINKVGSPYIINNSITVNQGVTLTIMPGVVLLFKPGISLIVNGKVNAFATLDNQIVFTGINDANCDGSGITSINNYWNGVDITSTGEFNGDNIKVKYGGRNSLGNIYTNGKLTLINSEVSNSYSYGIILENNNSVTIKQVNVCNNSSNGIYITKTLAGSSIIIENNTITNNSKNGISIGSMSTGSSISIENNAISNSKSGIDIGSMSTSSSLIIQNNTISNNNYGIYVPLGGIYGDLSGINNNIFTGNVLYQLIKYDAVVLSGNLVTDLTLPEGKYILDDIQVPLGKTLTISPGTILLFDYFAEITVNGKLNALGTIDKPIAFTIIEDSAYGGSGSTSYRWTGINITSTGEFNGDNIKARYGGYSGSGAIIYVNGKLTLTNSEVSNSYYSGIILENNDDVTIKQVNVCNNSAGGIYITKTLAGSDIAIQNSTVTDNRGRGISIGSMAADSSISIENSTITNSGDSGIYVGSLSTSSGLIIQNNTVENNKYGIWIDSIPAVSNIIIQNNSILNNNGYGIYLRLEGIYGNLSGINNNIFSGNILYDLIKYDALVLEGSLVTELTLPEGKYILRDVNVPLGKTLTISPGTILLFDYFAEITVNGKLNALGTIDKPIAFTIIEDSAYGGSGSTSYRWAGINITSTGEFNGDNIKARYGGFSGNGGIINVNGKLTLTNSEVGKSYIYGIFFNTPIPPTLLFNTFLDNTYGASIVNENPSTITIDASYNYWGTLSGPYKYNSSTGSWILDSHKVSTGVTVEPFLGSELKYQFQFGQEGTNSATGNFSRNYTDMTSGANNSFISITRTYNSRDDRLNSPLGRGWSFGFQGSVKDYGNNIPIKIVKLPDGSVETFNVNSDGTLTANDSRNTLIKQVDGTYTLTSKDQHSFGFNSNGYLCWIKDRYGNTTTINVDATGKVTGITDAVGRNITVTYNAEGLIDTVTDVANRTVKYGYTNNQLTSVTDPAGKITNYKYDGQGFLNEVKNNDSNLIDSVIYIHDVGDNKDKVTSTADAYGNTKTYTYDNTNKKTIITDSNGRTTTDYYDNFMYVIKSVDAEGKNTVTQYNIDANGNNKYGEQKSITDRNGAITSYVRDSNGNITTQTNSDGSTKVFVYGIKNNKTQEKDENSKVNIYIYDSNDVYLLQMIQPLNGTDIYSTIADQSKFAITTYTYYSDSEAQSLGYGSKGLLKQVTDPNGNITTYTYDAYGNIKTVNDGENNTTTYNYNNIGWKTSVTSPNGFVTSYVYDNNEKVLKSILNGGETTRTVYDNEGRILKEISARLYDSILDDVNKDIYTGDVGTRYTYNTNGTVENVQDAENKLTSYTYDIYGNVLTETKPDGAIYSYDYDVMNRVTHEYYQENAAATKLTLADYSYTILIGGKTQKNDTKHLNSTDTAVTISIYDYANRLIEQDNPDSKKVYASYNTNGTKATTTDARGSVTYYKYDGLNRPTEQWTPFESNSGTISYSYSRIDYDKAGRKIAEVIGKDKVAKNVVPTNVITISYSYYNNNKLKSQTDSSGKRTDYVYDIDGNVSKTTIYVDETTQNITEYQNNYFGKPDTKTVHVRKGDIYENNFTDNTDTLIQTSYTYDQDGNLKTMTNPAGVITTYEYDNLDRQLSVSQPGIDENGASATIKSSNTLRYDGKVLTTTDAKNNVTTNVYDGRGELISKTDAKNNISVSYYDLGGRKIAEVAPNDYTSGKDLSTMNKVEYSYDLMGRLLTIKSVYFDTIVNDWKSIVTKAYAYDANENVTKELDASGYASGTGLTVSAIIISGYGTVTTYNLENKPVTIQDPDTKDRALSYTVSYTYDGAGRKVSETNAKGAVTTYYYDDASNTLKITVKKTAAGVEKIIKSATYDGVGNVRTATDGNSNVTNYDYNALNKIKNVTYAGDSTIATDNVTYQYDVMGNLKWQGDSLGKVNIYTYDNQGSVLTSTEKVSDGSNLISTSTKYDANGNKRYVTDGNLVTTDNIYDELNRLISTSVTVNSVKQTTSFGYDANSNKTSVTDWRGNVTQNVYDPLNRLSKKIDAYGKSIETLEYYDNGAQSKSTDALNNVTQYFYDKNRRLLKTIDPENHTTSQTYDAVGNINSKTDGDLSKTSYVFDEFNNLLTITNEKGEVTSYIYDLNNNMLSQTDGKLNASNYEYNVANKMIKKIDNGGRTGSIGSYIYNPLKTESYTYYADGSLKSKTDRNGLVTNYTYDVHGRKLTEKVGTINISYTYDNNGNQLTIIDATGTTTRTYDELNTVTSKDVPSFGKSTYVYDIITDMSPGIWGESTTDPKGNVTLKVYDKTGRLLNVTADGKTNTYSYYDNGSLNSITYANGSSENYTYYNDNLLKTLTNKKSDGTIIDAYSYTYDGAHNMLTKVDGRGTTSYIYDKLNRLYTITQPDTTKTTYVYDATGNRQTQTVVKGSTSTVTSYSYNDQNKLMSSTTTVNTVKTQTTAYTYDNNGSQLTSVITPYISGIAGTTQTTTNIYDELNQLTQTVTSDGNSIVNIYNGEGVRVAKAINGVIIRYLYEGDKVILELNESGVVIAKNLYGTNLIARTAEGIKGYYLYNGHADVTGITAEDGNTLLATYYYDEFGILIGSTGNFNNSNTYAGYQYDSETKTYYLMARMYDPETARFLQEDSYRGDPNDPLSLNLYTYCHNNPVVYDDPNGHWLHIAVGALLGGVINTAITAASDYLDDGKFNSGWKEYAGSFVEGAIAGGVGAATGGASLFATAAAGAGAGFAGNASKQLITKGKINWKEAAISTAFDVGIGVAGNYAGKIAKNSKAGKYLASKVSDFAGKAKKQTVNLVANAKAFNQAWKEGKPNTVTFGSGFGALQDGIDRTGMAMKKVTEGVGKPVDVELKYKEGWTAAQKAEADAKVKALTEAPTIKTAPNRRGTSASSRYKSANGANSVPNGNDVDHVIDLQLGGADDILNMNPLDMSVNRSLGRQIQNKIKGYGFGTEFDKFTIK